MTGIPCRLFVVLVTFSGAIRAAEEDNNVRLAKPTPKQVAWHDFEIGTGNTFVVTVPGLGIPLKLEAIVRGKGGRVSSGRMLVSRAK